MAAPGRTVESIKAKLKSPSTGSKSKSDIPDSIGQLERDLRHNRDAPGNLDERGAGRVNKSGSFSSLFSKRPRNGGSESALSPRASALPDRRTASAINENALSDDDGPQEEEEDEEIVQQRIREGEKRLEELDEAQTVGLLRTQQEAGIEPVQSPEEPRKPGWLVACPCSALRLGIRRRVRRRGGAVFEVEAVEGRATWRPATTTSARRGRTRRCAPEQV